MALEDQEQRRGTRIRKQPDVLKTAQTPAVHGKKRATETERDEAQESELSDLSEDDESEAEDESASEVEASSKQRAKGKGSRKAPAGKKQPLKRKAPAKTSDVVVLDAGQDDKGTDGIKTDNGLFNAMLQSDIALQSFVEDWVETYLDTGGDEDAENQIVSELVIFFIRCCGLNSDVDADEAVDRDGIVDLVERIQDEAIESPQATYPLASRSKGMKPFRNNLNHFLHHLIITLSASPLLYQTPTHTPKGVKHVNPLVHVMLTWLISMSSCHYRPIRHTATYIALKLKSAFCEIAIQVSKDLGVAQRQRDAEAKKAAKSSRLADAEKRVKESHEKKMQLELYMDEVLDGAFVHRSRDSDAAIRTDCMRELGIWMKRYPERFVDLKYMHFYDWSLTDLSNSTRLETIKGLTSLYTNESNISNVRSFTLRVTPRLLQIALRDVDVSVRVAAIHILTLIEKAELLLEDEEEGRERMAWMIYDEEPRVHRAIGELVKIIWNDLKEEQLSAFTARQKKTKKAPKGKKTARAKEAENDKSMEDIDEAELDVRFGWKALATLLVKTSKDLDRATAKQAGETERELSQSLVTMRDLTSTLSATGLKGAGTRKRAAAAVEGLWNEIEQVQKWETLVQYLLLDHSETDEQEAEWALDEDEETFLLSMLLAILERSVAETAHKKVEDEGAAAEQTRVLIKALPKLFAKYHADSMRMADLLLLPQLIKLDMYLELRMANAYDNLWDDVSRQFLQHTDARVLQTAIRAIGHLSRNTAMANANKAKMAELEETLMASLRDAVAGRDVESSSFSDDEVTTIEAIMQRLSLLVMSKDLVETLEDEEGGQSSGWEIVFAFAERGKLGYDVEIKMVGFALQILSAYIAWSSKRFTKSDAENVDSCSALEIKRDRIVDLFEEFAIGDRSNAKEAVRRRAFFCFINVHIIFSARAGVHERPAAKALPLEMDDSKQFRLNGRLQASIERFAADIEEEESTVAEGSDAEMEDDDDEKRAPSVKKRRLDLDGDHVSIARREAEYEMLQDVSTFISAIRLGVIEAQHSAVALAHYGRFGHAYDACAKTLIDVLRDEGIFNNEGEMTQKVVGQALQDSFNIFLESGDVEPNATIALAKVAAGAFVIHGTHFTVLRKIDPQCLLDFHLDAAEWVSRRIANGIKAEKIAKSKQAKDRARKTWNNVLQYFKVLIPLVPNIAALSALKIKAKMQELFKAADIQPSATLKAWEPQRAYEKRLISIASKDPSIKSAAATKSKRKAPAVVEDEEDERDGEEAARDAGSPVPPRRRGPARVAAETSRGKSKTKAPVSASHVSDEGDNEDDDMEVEVEPSSLSEVSGKRARDDEDGNDVPAEGEDERRRSPSGESDEVVVEAPRSMSVGSFDGGRPVKRTRRG